MKRAPRLTKRERKALSPGPKPIAPAGHGHSHEHIHCVACGRHIDAHEIVPGGTATWLHCAHGTRFAACAEHAARGQGLLDEHDRTGQPVQAAGAWH